MLVLWCHSDDTSLIDNVLNAGIDEIVEGIKLLSNQTLLLKIRADDGPARDGEASINTHQVKRHPRGEKNNNKKPNPRPFLHSPGILFINLLIPIYIFVI